MLGKKGISLPLMQLFVFSRPGAADKGPGDAADACRHPQCSEEASGAGKEALPDRRSPQNFLQAQSLHQVGLLSPWGCKHRTALHQHPRGGEERREEGRPRTLWCQHCVQHAVSTSCSQGTSRETGGRGATWLRCAVWRTVVPVLIDSSQRSAVCSESIVQISWLLLFPLLQAGRRSPMLLLCTWLSFSFPHSAACSGHCRLCCTQSLCPGLRADPSYAHSRCLCPLHPAACTQ